MKTKQLPQLIYMYISMEYLNTFL